MAKATKGGKVEGAGRKGGTRFPNYNLKQLLPNLKELTGKTHTKPITIQQLNAGVFKTKANSIPGKIRFSSLKQFQLAEGEYAAISASPLSTSIVLADGENKIQYLREAVFNVTPFKNTFETFQDSTVNKSRIKEYAVSSLRVHLESADKFVDAFLESAEVAKLCTNKGEEATFISTKQLEAKSPKVDPNPSVNQESETNDEFEDETPDESIEENDESDIEDENLRKDNSNDNINDSAKTTKVSRTSPSIGIQVDSTLDPDKLAKQLKLLRKYGLI